MQLYLLLKENSFTRECSKTFQEVLLPIKNIPNKWQDQSELEQFIQKLYCIENVLIPAQAILSLIRLFLSIVSFPYIMSQMSFQEAGRLTLGHLSLSLMTLALIPFIPILTLFNYASIVIKITLDKILEEPFVPNQSAGASSNAAIKIIPSDPFIGNDLAQSELASSVDNAQISQTLAIEDTSGLSYSKYS